MTQARTRKNSEELSSQVEEKIQQDKKQKKAKPENDSNFNQVVSTGSTLLDLAISGGIVRGGGIPGGILIEIFGPPGIGKTAMLCEIGGAVQRAGGETKFMDPESRLSATFANMFDLKLREDEISFPDTPTDVFKIIDEWQPENSNVINAALIDSTAALASDLEMENKKDEYQRRAKLFSQGFRVACRKIPKKNIIMVCSNQIREKMDTGFGGEKTDTPGGKAMKFYSSLRIKVSKTSPHKLKRKTHYQGKEVEKTVGISVNMEVYKSSICEPYHVAPVHILFDYGIDDIRANLDFVKKYTDSNMYYANNIKLSNGLDDSILKVEEDDLEDELKEQVINIWSEIEEKFRKKRKEKKR